MPSTVKSPPKKWGRNKHGEFRITMVFQKDDFMGQIEVFCFFLGGEGDHVNCKLAFIGFVNHQFLLIGFSLDISEPPTHQLLKMQLAMDIMTPHHTPAAWLLNSPRVTLGVVVWC